nr:DNA mismatch repair protein MSH7 isoform X1 [Ipomoea batatas]
MKRQSSILSFLKKPSPEDQRSGGATLNGNQPTHLQHNKNAPPPTKCAVLPSTLDLTEEPKGTDTPPEKIPRQIFPTNDDGSGTKPSVFDSIKHKFVKFHNGEKNSDRNLTSGGTLMMSSVTGGSERSEVHGDASLGSKLLAKENAVGFNRTIKQGDNGCSSVIVINDDAPGPETPGTRPLVPRVKRVQEDAQGLQDKGDCSALNMNKRFKTLQDSIIVRKNLEEVSEMTSKFEWLHPSRIKDANGRRPGDPSFDKNTLYIPPDALRKMSASQKQYWGVKCRYMDVVLFFKVGKFYELYELDADIGHKELDWKITMSGVGKCRQVGISESGIDDAVQKLLARGYKVGRIEQLETSEQAKSRGSTSVIQRKLVNVLTPATSSEGNIGPDVVHLLSIKEGCLDVEKGSTAFGFAFVDCAALKFWVGSISDDASCAALGSLLMQISAKEVIYDSRGLSKEAQKALKKYSLTGTAAPQLTPIQQDADFVDSLEVKNFVQLKGYFKGSLNGWDHVFDGVMHQDLAFCAFGALASHLTRLMLDDVLRNGDILTYEVYRGFLRMDGQTLVNLEIFSNSADGGPSGTLYKYLDNCITSSGKRLLRSWICHPLKDADTVNLRLNVVEELMTHSEAMSFVAQYFRKLPDLERLLGRVKASNQSSAELLLPTIGRKLLKQRVKVFGSLVKGLRIGMDLLMLLQKEEQLSSSLSKVFRLPVLHGNDGLHKFLTQFEAAIDSDFPNYQDHDITESDAETLSILMELFIEKATEWSQVIYAIGCVDVLRSFAVTATFSTGAMCRPIILPLSESTNLSYENKGPVLEMKGLWHPYALGESEGLPVPNDLQLGGETDYYNRRTLLLTGPNMGGKSTLLRATCLAVVMAQMGCYVPCEAFTLSLVDIIFTRLGATDRIMTGESTFFIECRETASVLQNATQNSLVLLDELGRGTSTFDGYAIAYAVFRHLVEIVNCRLLFATHYHALTKEFGSHPHVILKHMACSFKSNQELVFLYRLASGACPESYGMQVALMAGIPQEVVKSASKAGKVMKTKIGESFRSSEQRSSFSTLHEEWLKSLVLISKSGESELDEDTFDTLFCMWHELRTSDGFLNSAASHQ